MANTPSCAAVRAVLDGALGPVSVVIRGTEYPLRTLPREFSTGSKGVNISGRVDLALDGEVVALQVSGNVVLCHSKGVDPA